MDVDRRVVSRTDEADITGAAGMSDLAPRFCGALAKGGDVMGAARITKTMFMATNGMVI